MAFYPEQLIATFGAGHAGAGTNVGYTVYDSTGTIRIARTTAGITEVTDHANAGVGTYVALPQIDTAWFPARVHWDINGASGVFFDAIIGEAEAESEVADDTVAPVTPTGLAINDPGTGVPVISWTANPESNILNYEVTRMPGNVKIYRGTATSCLDAGLFPGTTVGYIVRAKNTQKQLSSACAQVSYTVPNYGYAQPLWNGPQASSIPAKGPSWNGPQLY